MVLVAFDERMLAYRHPAPTAGSCSAGRSSSAAPSSHGLIFSISRIVSFGDPGAEFRKRYAACARVNAEFIDGTRPGALACDVFARGVAAYAETGYPDEWTRHHQGGAMGYACRDYIADAGCRKVVQERQLFGWNPSILGTKIEDTILVDMGGPGDLDRDAVLAAVRGGDGWQENPLLGRPRTLGRWARRGRGEPGPRP